MKIEELFAVIRERQAVAPVGSYTAELLAGGPEAICQKVGEEAVEVIVAAMGQSRERLVEETADLFYHTLVLLAWAGLDLADIEAELARRHRGR